MNSMPDFDDIGRTVPLEGPWFLRTLATLRLCIVVVAMYVCLLQLFQIGFWSSMADRAIILLGLWGGLGIYADSTEILWRRLGVLGRFATLVLLLVLVTGSLAQGGRIWFGGTMVWIIFLLGSMAYGLLHMLISPLRALRFRQMKKYLRTLPTEKRRTMRHRLELNFQTLIAEGFH